MPQTPRGTKDILPNEILFWQEIETKSRKILSTFGYSEIKTPIIEETALFIRSLGKETDIVDKQIFNVSVHKNKEKDTQLSLRPEGTAGIIRSYIEHNLDKTMGLAKLYYIGPMFRAERPQKGRLRQFNHIGAEAIGASSPYLDVEIISLAANILEGVGIKDYTLKLNSLGCAKDKKNISNSLKKAVSPVVKKLCPNCNRRFSSNVLRILDCKNQQCKKNIKDALDKSGFADKKHLCKDCLTDINIVENMLKDLKIKYVFDNFLVRGLDYYTKTVFEITHSKLGAQDAIAAGGRYDNLTKELGGPDVGAVGFAFGVERLLLAGDFKNAATKLNIYVISLGDKARETTIPLLNELRKAGISCDTDYENKSLKGQMRRANNSSARFVCIIGEDELAKSVATIKDMESGEQEELSLSNLIDTLKMKLGVKE